MVKEIFDDRTNSDRILCQSVFAEQHQTLIGFDRQNKPIFLQLEESL
jgi:hypothetical protein